MKLRIAAVLVTASLLGGCTDADWDHAFAYVGVDTGAKPEAPAAPAAAPVDPASAREQWCVDIANAAQNEAIRQGFDAATQQNRAKIAYTQCLQIQPAQ